MMSVLRTRHLLALVACCAGIAVVTAGCGGGGDSAKSAPEGDVAVVDGQAIKETTLKALIAQSARTLKAQKQSVPKEGSPEYQQLVDRVVSYLVTKAEVEQQAKKLGVTVTPKELRAAFDAFVKQNFKGKESELDKALKRLDVSRASVMENIRFSALQQEVVKKLTTGLETTDQEAREYYLEHAPDYATGQTRHVEHILVKTKKLADSIYTQLKKGADFAKLAKKYSTDTASKVKGGDLGEVEKGKLVPEFEKVVFDQAFKTGELSKPVKSSFGWHVIEALGPIKPRHTIPFKDVKASIVQQLDQAKRSSKLSDFQSKLEKYYATRVTYGKKYQPATTPTSTTPSFSIPTETVGG
jgi:parvulin-like peptidyl-prolyl isomerase